MLGDRAYGGPLRFGLKRQFLHAARLAFPHPVTGEPIDISSPLPADLEGRWSWHAPRPLTSVSYTRWRSVIDPPRAAGSRPAPG